MSAPSVTLITICWNAEATLARTLDSVLAQGIPPAEYRVVDGGSTDGTLALLEEYRPRFLERGIPLLVEPQKRVPGEAGIPNAWNQALREAEGEVVGLLNADDWYEPALLARMCDAFGADPGLGAVSVPVSMDHPDPGKSWIFHPQPLSRLPWKMPVPHPGTFFRRSVYETVGLYDTTLRIAADYDFVWRCRVVGVKWRYLPEPAGVHMQLGGLANSSRALARRETYRAARKHGSFWNPVPALALLLRILLGR